MREKDNYDAGYYYNPGDFQIRYIEMQPAKLPTFVREMKFRHTLERNPDQIYHLSVFKMRLSASILVKKYRVEIYESYANVLFQPQVSPWPPAVKAVGIISWQAFLSGCAALSAACSK